MFSVDTKAYRKGYTYVKDRLRTVSHNTDDPDVNVIYTFETDELGNQTTVKVGTQLLSTNVYTGTGDKLLTAVEYANGGKVSYTYDSFKRVTGIAYDADTTPRFTYEYGANGAVARVKDTDLDREARMAYDLVERPAEAELYENGALKYRLTQEYDRFEQPSMLHERVEEPDDTRSEHTVTVAYDKESKPVAITCESSRMTAIGVPDAVTKRKLTYRYDGLGRTLRRDFYADGDANMETATPLFQSEYAYSKGGYGANSTTTRVRSIAQAGQTREYWYDKLGNITRERWQGKAAAGGNISFESDSVTSAEGDALTLDVSTLDARYSTTYAYDALGQLLRANDERAGATWTYAYDLGGNLLEKNRYAYTTAADLSALTPAQTVSYTYGDANWKDKLTAYNGKAIAYDPTDKPSDYNSIGNPLTYDGWTYTWKAGRMLNSMVRGGENPVNAQYTYGHTGLRVKKSVNGVDTLYTLNGKKITHIRKGMNNATSTDAVQMHFFYDAQGRPMLVRYMDTDYAYLHNLQGDIVGIVDMNGALAVEYAYDAWGKPISTQGSMAETLGKDNPFRYRGYVWDEETGLYYLRSRYYDPSWGRFVNADAFIGELGTAFSHNMFTYCDNNPMNMTDSSGFEPSPWSSDNWSRVGALSQEDIFTHNHKYRNIHGEKAKEPATLHILVGNNVVSIEVRLDPIGHYYHIDTRFADEPAGRLAMREIITAVKGESELVGNSKDGFRDHNNPVKCPAYLEMSDGTLTACAVQLYPHHIDSFTKENGHFDVYLKKSSKGKKKADALVRNMRAMVRRSYHAAQMRLFLRNLRY